MSLIEHIESRLGTIDKSWKLTDSSSGLSVATFPEKPVEEAVTYVTLGLSHHILEMLEGRTVRQELVFAAWKGFPSGDIASFLSTFCEFIISKHQALLRGDVVGPTTPIIADSSLTAVYSSPPVIFEDGLDLYSKSTPPTILVWVIPIHAVEAEFVKTSGWSKFEDLLESEDPDLLDLRRKPIL